MGKDKSLQTKGTTKICNSTLFGVLSLSSKPSNCIAKFPICVTSSEQLSFLRKAYKKWTKKMPVLRPGSIKVKKEPSNERIWDATFFLVNSRSMITLMWEPIWKVNYHKAKEYLQCTIVRQISGTFFLHKQ